MNNKKKHEYFDFMKSIQDGMAQEYVRIQKRALEDPGTAGDQAEENWATLFRDWLPANYPVVTKGRIINEGGIVSPQVDVLVLHPSYPMALRDKKIYFAGGVAAAFECKLTLRAMHLKKAINNAIKIKDMVPHREGNIYDELHQSIVFGLLAHSHEIKSTGLTVASGITLKLDEYTRKVLQELSSHSPELIHPRNLMDLVCVADTTTIVLTNRVEIGPTKHESVTEYEERVEAYPDSPMGGVSTCYMLQPEKTLDNSIEFQGYRLGALIFDITKRLAFEDSSLQSFASYLGGLGIWGGYGPVINWNSEAFSDAVISRIMKEGYQEDMFSRWNKDY
jgi:hypothetical protein